MQIKTGKGTTISLIAVIDIYIILIATFLPGYAIAPILGKLNSVFPGASDMEIQLLSTMPSIAIIPFILIGGKMATRISTTLLLNIGFSIFAASGAIMLFTKSLLWLIILSTIMGIGAGIIIPLSATLFARIFTGEARVRQFGYSSATSNIAMVGIIIFVGYIAKINWHLPFSIYMLGIIPIALSPFLRKYIKRPKQEILQLTKDGKQIKVNIYKEINIPKIIQYMCYHGLANFMGMCISVNLPFLMEQYHHGSGITSDLMSLIYIAGMLPGFFLNPLVKVFGVYIYEVCMYMIALGFGIILISSSLWVIASGIMIMWIFYGVVMPFIY